MEKGESFIPDSKNSAILGQTEGVGTEAINQFFFFLGEGGEIPPDFCQRLNLPTLARVIFLVREIS